MKYYCKEAKTPVGLLRLVASEKGIAAILWEKDSPQRASLRGLQESSDHPLLLQLEKQLQEYFDKKRTRFDLPLDPQGTEFQKKVWLALRKIPYGETKSYVQIAQALGKPSASRAVGAANSRNPLSIVVPCHRVIGANGKLTGFAGGLDNKSFLLKLEGISLC